MSELENFDFTPREKKTGGCMWPVFFIILAFLVCGAGIFLYFGESVKGLLERYSGGFLTSQVTTTNRDIILEIHRTHGDNLEVASPMKTSEIFNREDSRYAAWGKLYLGTTFSEVKANATYRFHIKLSELRDGRLENGVLTVTAPTIHPSLPVAIDTSTLEKKTGGGWLRFDAQEQLVELEKSMTPTLNKRAATHAKTVREHARKDIEEFVQKWVVESRPEFQSEVRAIKIVFADEKPEDIKKVLPLP